MKFQELKIPGLVLIDLPSYPDERGSFAEIYREDLLAAHQCRAHFNQFNRSFSKPHVLRGLHAQTKPAQTKWIQIFRGAILDVIVDLRKESSRFGTAASIELRADRLQALWIPPGCAHGFCVLGNEVAEVFYAVDAPHSKDSEIGVRWNDPALQIPWPYADPILSAKDSAWPLFKDLAKVL